MKSESIEPQNTQKCAEIYNGSREGQEKKFMCLFALSAVKKTTEYTEYAKNNSCSSCSPLARKKHRMKKLKFV